MAVAKGLVLAFINKKFGDKSLSKTFKESLAAKWAEKIETDTDIETFVLDREDVILEASSEADRVRNLHKPTPPKPGPPKPGDTPTETDDLDLPADTPAYVKVILENQKKMADKLERFEAEKQGQTLAAKFKAHEDIKGIPDVFLKGNMPTDEAGFDAAVAAAKADFEEFKSQNPTWTPAPAPTGSDTPGYTNQQPKPDDGKVDPGIAAFVEARKAKNEAQKV